jgi:hypothetical protein
MIDKVYHTFLFSECAGVPGQLKRNISNFIFLTKIHLQNEIIFLKTIKFLLQYKSQLKFIIFKGENFLSPEKFRVLAEVFILMESLSEIYFLDDCFTTSKNLFSTFQEYLKI